MCRCIGVGVEMCTQTLQELNDIFLYTIFSVFKFYRIRRVIIKEEVLYNIAIISIQYTATYYKKIVKFELRFR